MTSPSYGRNPAISMPWPRDLQEEAATRATGVEDDGLDAMAHGGMDRDFDRSSMYSGAEAADNVERLFREAQNARRLDQLREACPRQARTPPHGGTWPMTATAPPAHAGGVFSQPLQPPCQLPLQQPFQQGFAQPFQQPFPSTAPVFRGSFPTASPYGAQLPFQSAPGSFFSPLGGTGNPFLSGGIGLALGLGLSGLASGLGAFLGGALGGFGGFGPGFGFGRGWCDFSPSYCGWW
ncbi:hypothetical protein [Roseateles sp. L2-2]|uniref:hypothetical protein n=1 Tax=Roseateles sp. L2-2 TaxID=3422597 RepID=UPI003D3685B2